jgi:acetylornithine deacetylase/succinyl-diaminopimelate desuccinylase-like protein
MKCRGIHSLMALVVGMTASLMIRAATPPPQPGADESVRKEAREIFASIIAIETSVGKGQVPAMAEYLAERFRLAGFPQADIHILPVGETASLIVRYRGNGKGGKPIAFMGHMDVVTAKREDWVRDPYLLTEENGYFFGRGAQDMKSDIAMLTETFLHLKRQGYVPSRDLLIAFSGDEETTQVSTEDMVKNHRDVMNAEFALNGDGGGGTVSEETGKAVFYDVQGAEKSSVTYELTATNPGGHSSRPRPDNAIYDIADAISAIRQYSFPVKWNEWTIGNFKETGAVTTGSLGSAMLTFAAHPDDAAAAAEIAKDPAFIGLTRTTCVATMLRAGHAVNALPQSAIASVNCRIFPGTSAEEVKKTLQQLAGKNVAVTLVDIPVVSDASIMRPDVMKAVAHAVNLTHPGAVVSPNMAAYATDGAVFRNYGIPTYGTSALFMKHSDEFAHGLNERISVDTFYAGLTHWDVLIRDLTGPQHAQH